MTFDLARLDDAWEAAGRDQYPVAPAAAGKAGVAVVTSAVIANGFYTLTFPSGEHRTFRIRTETAGKLVGKRTFAMLVGPDNTSEYESFAFVTDDGIQVWKRFKNAKQAEYARLVWMLATGAEADGYELMISKRCLICNHLLTDDESIGRGIGPTCWERIHG